MKILSDFGWNLRRYAPAASTRQTPADTSKKNMDRALVRSIAAPHSAPTAMIAQRIAALVDRVGALPFDTLVEEVAGDLYREELGHGAAVLDIGVFGSRLFQPDVIAALQAGDGIYWEIKKQRAGQ